MCFGLGFLSGGCSLEDWAISSGIDLYENGIGLSWDAIDGDILVLPLECSGEDQEELPVRTQCMMPISVGEYTRKEKGKEKMIAHEENRPSSSMVKFRYCQERKSLCQDIYIWFSAFIASVFCLGPPKFLMPCVKTIKYEQMPAYYFPCPNSGDPRFEIFSRMREDYAARFVDVNVLEEAWRILGDSPTTVLAMMFFAFFRKGYDLVGTESFTHDLLHGGWNMALQRPPKQTELILSMHADEVFTGHRGISASNSDDYSIGCLLPVSSTFLGLYRNSEFGSQIYSWRESPSGQRTESSYGRAPDYSNLGPFRLPKNPNRVTDPPTAEFQQVLHSGKEGAERERQCYMGWATYGAWNVSNKTRKRKRSISASPSSRSLESRLSSLLFVLDSPRERAEELSLNSGSIYGALGGGGSKARGSLPGRTSGSSAQSSRTMRGRLRNNILMPIKNGEQSIRSGCTSFHIAVTSNGPFGTQYGLLGFRVEQDGSSACVIDNSELRFGSGQSLKKLGCQVGAYIGPDKCAICQEGWTSGRSPEVAKSRDGCETYLGPGWPWAELRAREGNGRGGYPSGSVSRVSAKENIPHAAHTRSSEGPINASCMRSNIFDGNLNSVGSDLIRSSAAWPTVTESMQPIVLRQRRILLEHQSNNYVTNDSLELSHPDNFSLLGDPQSTAPLNADSFECEYWERYGIEIGEEGEGGWRDLGQLVSEEGIFDSSVVAAWPHSEAYIKAGIRSEPFNSASPGPVSGDALVKSAAPPRLRALVLAAELLESVSSDLRRVSLTNLGSLDSAVVMLNQFIQEHNEVYNGVSREYTDTGSCPGGGPEGINLNDQGGSPREAGNQTKQKSGNDSLCGYTNAQVITGGSSISKSRVFSAEEAGTEPIPVTSLTVAPESVTYAQKKQTRRRGRFGFLDKGSSFNTSALGRPEYSASGIARSNIGGICSDTAVSLIPSRPDTKPEATAARGSVLISSGDDRFSKAAVSLVTKMKPPFSPDISYPKGQEIGARRISQKGSKIPVLVKKAGGRREAAERPRNIITPIPWNRENSPFNSVVPASSLRRPLFEKKSVGERNGSPTVRKIGSRLPYKNMC